MSDKNQQPINQRTGYIEHARHAVTSDLSRLAEKHRLDGAVLITFDGRALAYGATSCAVNDKMLALMDALATAILTNLDDGVYDPEKLLAGNEAAA